MALLLASLVFNLSASIGIFKLFAKEDIKQFELQVPTVLTALIILTSMQTLIVGVLGFLYPTSLAISSIIMGTPFLKGFLQTIKKTNGTTIILICLSIILVIANPTIFSFDDKQYHALNAAIWIKNQTINLNNVVDYTGYYFFNGILFSTFLMVFTKMNIDVFIIRNIILILILIYSYQHLSKKMNIIIMVPLLLLLFANPSFILIFRYFSSPEVFSAILIVFLISFSNATIDSENKRIIYFKFILMGFISGMKVTFLIFIMPLLIYEIYLLYCKKDIFLFLGCALYFSAMSSYWFFQNLIVTANPLFPFEFFNFPHLISKKMASELTIISVFKNYDIPIYKLTELFGLRPLSQFFTASTLALFLYGVFKELRKKQISGEVLVSFGILGFMLIYPNFPSSGKGEDTTFAFASFRRFFIIIPILLPVFIFKLNYFFKNRINISIFITAVIFCYYLRLQNFQMLLVCSLTLISIITLKINKKLKTIPFFWILITIVFIGIHDFRQSELKFIDKTQKNSNIALINNFKPPALSLLGKDLDRNFIRINRQGEKISPFHQNMSKVEPIDIWPNALPEINFTKETFFKNLINSDINYVVFEKLPPHFRQYGDYPERIKFFSSENSELLYDDGFHKLYRLK